MAGPLHTVWVRHGESEHNFAIRADKEGFKHLIPPEVYTRPDWEHPLTPLGHTQGGIANNWMAYNIGDPDTYFDSYLFTPALRGRQTAGHLAPKGQWRKNDAVIEQDWGEFGMVPYAEREELFPHAWRMKHEANLYARLNGGESPMDQLTRLWVTRIQLNEKYADKRVLIAAHGGTLTMARYMYEHMLPEEFHASEKDRAQMLGNCAILEYSRVNPNDPEDIVPYNRWRRITQPDNLAASPFGGEWCELPGRREYSGSDLLAQAAAFPELITPDIFAQIPPKQD